MRIRWLLRLAPLLAALPLLAAPAPFDPLQFTTGEFRGCPPQGEGGDPDLNVLKNRDVPPPATVVAPLTVNQILTFRPAEVVRMGRKLRRNWTVTARNEVMAWEQTGAVVQGYLVTVKRGGREGCNCTEDGTGSLPDDLLDFHFVVGANPTDDQSRAVVMEITPRQQPAHPNWRFPALRAMARQRARVRVTGWLMWDQEHPPEVGRTRGTLWEIHPIHRIQVFRAGQWQEF